MSEEQLPFGLEMHFSSMPFIWSVGIDLTIFFALYRYRNYSILLHIIGGVICILFTLITSLPVLLEHGIPDKQDVAYNHFLFGIFLYFVIFLQAIFGISSKLLTCFTNLESIHIYRINKVHKYIGYTLALLCKIQAMSILNDIYEQDGIEAEYQYNSFSFNVFWNLGLLSLLILRKKIFKTLSMTILPHNSPFKMIMPQITCLVQLNQKNEKQSYLIFANYVYKAQTLLRVHPIGFQVIETVLNKQIDRFMYGMYTSQKTPQLPIHSHTFRSLALLDLPIAKITIPDVYQNIPQICRVKLHSAKPINESSQTHHVTLQLIDRQTQFIGYTHLNQLGRYYSLTIDNQTTRLYTSVNFLNYKNVQLMKRIARKHFKYVEKFKEPRELTQIRLKINDDQTVANPLNSLQMDQQKPITSTIPLLIKKYQNGKLTSKLFEGKNIQNLQFSCSRGEGLKLSQLQKGRICILAGGTGLFPFSDLIDLLYKVKIMKTRTQYSLQINKYNPILRDNALDKFSFTLVFAAQTLADLHPITLMQIQELSIDQNLFEVYFKIKLEFPSQQYDEKNRYIKKLNDPFQIFLRKKINQGISYDRYWVCGPPKMNQNLSVFFQSNNVMNYHIL